MATVQNGQTKQLTAQDRALLFTQSTRQNFQMLPRQTVSGERSTVAFTLPKVRLIIIYFVRSGSNRNFDK